MRRFLRGLSLAVLVVSCAGCSLIGFTTGSIIDAQEPDMVVTTRVNAVALPPGTPIEILLPDGTKITGTCAAPKHEVGRSGLSIQDGDVRRFVPLADAREIRAPPRRHAKWTLLAAGVAVDLVVGVGIATFELSD